jgi:tetratricopeptide (TPR) repeat protein
MSLPSSQTPSDDKLLESGHRLVARTVDHLRRCDDRALLEELCGHWAPEQLAALLACPDDNVVKVAATCLGLVGTAAECSALAAVLQHDDSVAVAMADFALWQIWFRHGSVDACRSLCRAVCLIESGDHDSAVELLTEIIRRSPCYAEAYNQRAVAHYLRGAYAEAAADARQAVRINPTHFAAYAGLGNCLLHLGRITEAIEAYHAALRIHPRLEGIRQSIREARNLAGSTPTASA